MKINYKIHEAQPEWELLQVQFTNDAGQEFWRNFNPMDWSADAIRAEIEGYAPHVVAFFNRQKARSVNVMNGIPMEGSFESEEQAYHLGPMPADPKPTDPPEYDPWTQTAFVKPAEFGAEFYEWEVVDKTPEERAEYAAATEFALRMQRNQLLLESDFFNFPDACVANVQDWLDYRQALRDLPTDPSWPKNVLWPTKPELVKESN